MEALVKSTTEEGYYEGTMLVHRGEWGIFQNSYGIIRVVHKHDEWTAGDGAAYSCRCYRCKKQAPEWAIKYIKLIGNVEYQKRL